MSQDLISLTDLYNSQELQKSKMLCDVGNQHQFNMNRKDSLKKCTNSQINEDFIKRYMEDFFSSPTSIPTGSQIDINDINSQDLLNFCYSQHRLSNNQEPFVLNEEIIKLYLKDYFGSPDSIKICSPKDHIISEINSQDLYRLSQPKQSQENSQEEEAKYLRDFVSSPELIEIDSQKVQDVVDALNKISSQDFLKCETISNGGDHFDVLNSDVGKKEIRKNRIDRVVFNDCAQPSQKHQHYQQQPESAYTQLKACQTSVIRHSSNINCDNYKPVDKENNVLYQQTYSDHSLMQAKQIQMFNYLNNYSLPYKNNITQCSSEFHEQNYPILCKKVQNPKQLNSKNSFHSIESEIAQTKRLRTSSISSTCVSPTLCDSDLSSNVDNDVETSTKDSIEQHKCYNKSTEIDQPVPPAHGEKRENSRFKNRSEYLLDRKQRNRLAAQKLRDKRKHEDDQLFQECKTLNNRNDYLRKQIDLLTKEIMQYRQHLKNFLMKKC